MTGRRLRQGGLRDLSRSEMSATVVATPTTAPDSSHSGEALTFTGNRVPSLRWCQLSKRSTRTPDNAARWAASNSTRVPSGSSASAGRPTTCVAEYPKMRSAAGFQVVTLPSTSRQNTASAEAWTAWASRASSGEARPLTVASALTASIAGTVAARRVS